MTNEHVERLKKLRAWLAEPDDEKNGLDTAALSAAYETAKSSGASEFVAQKYAAGHWPRELPAIDAALGKLAAARALAEQRDGEVQANGSEKGR